MAKGIPKHPKIGTRPNRVETRLRGAVIAEKR
jgi:hypothetical protein